MPKSGKILHYDPTIPPAAPVSAATETELPELTPSEALEELVRIIRTGGQDPVTQLAGYLIADDPTYLPECCQARALARRIGRDKLLATLIESYLTATTPTPSSDHT